MEGTAICRQTCLKVIYRIVFDDGVWKVAATFTTIIISGKIAML